MDVCLPELVYLGVSVTCGFCAGIYTNRARFRAICSIVVAFADEAREYYRIKADGMITDVEAQELAATVNAFFVAVEKLGFEMRKD